MRTNGQSMRGKQVNNQFLKEGRTERTDQNKTKGWSGRQDQKMSIHGVLFSPFKRLVPLHPIRVVFFFVTQAVALSSSISRRQVCGKPRYNGVYGQSSMPVSHCSLRLKYSHGGMAKWGNGAGVAKTDHLYQNTQCRSTPVPLPLPFHSFLVCLLGSLDEETTELPNRQRSAPE